MQSLLISVSGERVFVVCSSQLLHRKFCGTTGLRAAYSHILSVPGCTWGPGPQPVTHLRSP